MTTKPNIPYDASIADKVQFIMQSLITGSTARKSILRTCLTEFEIDIHTPKRIILIHMNPSTHISDIPIFKSLVSQLSESIPFDLIHFIYPDSYQILFDDCQIDKALPLLQEFAQKHNNILKIAVGRPSDIFQLRTSYLSALLTLKNISDTDQFFADSDSMLLDLLLMGIPSKLRIEYLQILLEKLSAEDFSFLSAYFKEDCSLKYTAKRLYMHPNTVQRRLDRIAYKTGLNPRRFEEAVLLYVALKLNAINHISPPK